MKHEKLVRDNIPQIISESGQTAQTRILNEAEYKAELQRKLQEEVAEYLEDNSIYELADILEVIEALCILHGFSKEALLTAKEEKAQKNGKFEKRIYLISTEEKPDEHK